MDFWPRVVYYSIDNGDELQPHRCILNFRFHIIVPSTLRKSSDPRFSTIISGDWGLALEGFNQSKLGHAGISLVSLN